MAQGFFQVLSKKAHKRVFLIPDHSKRVLIPGCRFSGIRRMSHEGGFVYWLFRESLIIGSPFLGYSNTVLLTEFSFPTIPRKCCKRGLVSKLFQEVLGNSSRSLDCPRKPYKRFLFPDYSKRLLGRGFVVWPFKESCK